MSVNMSLPRAEGTTQRRCVFMFIYLIQVLGDEDRDPEEVRSRTSDPSWCLSSLNVLTCKNTRIQECKPVSRNKNHEKQVTESEFRRGGGVTL